MAKNRKKATVINTQKPSILETLNEPAVEMTDHMSRGIIGIAVFIMMFAWLSPYFGTVNVQAYYDGADMRERVAGATISVAPATEAPQWYQDANDYANAVVDQFGSSAYSMLDISAPVTEITETYSPGVDAVWTTWLQLSQTPQF